MFKDFENQSVYDALLNNSSGPIPKLEINQKIIEYVQ